MWWSDGQGIGFIEGSERTGNGMVDVPAAASRLAEELRASRQVSGLSFGQIIQQGKRQSPPVVLTKSTLSAWFNAQSVPRAGHPFPS